MKLRKVNKKADKAGVPKSFPKALVTRPETLFQKEEKEKK